MENIFEKLGSILNPENKTFQEVYVCPDYAVNTLINGNISECIYYLRELIGTGSVGMKEAHEQLLKIKEQCPERYQNIKVKVFGF